jgi:ATP/maltotriose-dependent transcriptional regulator MalT
LVAPAGYGKTTLAQQFMSNHPAGAWCTATRACRDAVVLAREIAAAVASASGGSAAHFEEFLRTVDSSTRDADRLTNALIADIASTGVGLLVVDDYHLLLSAREAEEMITAIRERSTLVLTLASRTRPSWATARSVLYGDVLEITSDELAMTSAESHELLGGRPLIVQDRLAAQARGWPALVGLAALTHGANPPDDALPSALYDFFAEELFRAAHHPLQDALITLALLPELTADSLHRAFGDRVDSVLRNAKDFGAISFVQDRYELHPLIRDFLIGKLQRQPGSLRRVREAVADSLELSAWDAAIELIQKFGLHDLVETFVCAAYRPLLKTGRLSTLVAFANYSRKQGISSPVSLDLIDAAAALVEGEPARAEEIAIRVARQLGAAHPLTSSAHSIAGHAAFSSWHASRSEAHFLRAFETAVTDEDAGEAIWGGALAAMYAGTQRLPEAVEALRNRRDRSAVDLVRYTLARLAYARIGDGLSAISDLEDALHVARHLDDPRTRTSFTTSYGYYRGLRADYATALGLARETLADATAFDLQFVVPHAYWNIAFSYLGLRQFAQAERALRHVERHAADAEDPYHLLNSRCLRARFLLEINQTTRAVEQVDDDLVPVPVDAMWREYLATRALAQAVAGDDDKAMSLSSGLLAKAHAPVEARALAHMARAVVCARASDDEGVISAITACADLGTWDPFVCTVRAYPTILGIARESPSLRVQLETVLARSRDIALAARFGFRLRPARTSTSPTLSPREQEVMNHVRNGLTNREIAKALFISETTVKVHVRHSMRKLQARTRTEAASIATDYETD